MRWRLLVSYLTKALTKNSQEATLLGVIPLSCVGSYSSLAITCIVNPFAFNTRLRPVSGPGLAFVSDPGSRASEARGGSWR